MDTCTGLDGYCRTLAEADSAERDSLGNPLSESQSAYFRGSKARDSSGRLLVCYHGTTAGKRFTSFDPAKGSSQFGEYKFGKFPVSYFSTSKDVARGYTEIGVERDSNIYYCYLNIVNPYTVSNSTDDDVRSWARIRDRNIRDLQTKAYRSFMAKWSARSDNGIGGCLDEFNWDLRPFGFVMREYDSGREYDMYSRGRNTMFGSSSSVIEGVSTVGELIGDPDFRGCMIGDGDDDWFFGNDDIVGWVLYSNEQLGTHYDGIIIPDIGDVGPTGSMFQENGTDMATISSPSQIKRVTDRNPTGSDSIDESVSFGGFVDVYTWQIPEVEAELVSGKTYRASYANIFAPEYEEQYRRLSRLLGLRGCPIFGVFMDSLDGLDDSNDARAATASMDVHDGTKVPLHLRIPESEVFDTDYYGWSDYLYFSSDVSIGDRNPFGYDESESLSHLSRFMGFSRGGRSGSFNTSQAVFGEIRPEWLVR